MLADRGRAMTKASGRLREIHRGRRERRLARESGIVRVLEELRGADVRVLQRLLRRVERRRRNLRALQPGQRLRRRAGRGPLRHALGDRLTVVAAREVVLEARIVEPVPLAHQRGPAREHRLADRGGEDPAVPRPVKIGRRRRLTAVHRGHPVGLGHLLLDERRIVEGDRGAEQRALDLLTPAGLAARHERRQRAERGERRRPAVDPRHRRPQRLLGRAGQVGRAAHHLADAVEAVLVAPRAAGAERGDRGQDDVRLDPTEALEVEGERSQDFGRQVGDDDVGGRHELADDLAALGARRVERHRALVAVHHEIQRADAVRRHRRDPAILAATAALDADHVGAQVGQERRAVRARDVPPEVEDARARENAVEVPIMLGHGRSSSYMDDWF